MNVVCLGVSIPISRNPHTPRSCALRYRPDLNLFARRTPLPYTGDVIPTSRTLALAAVAGVLGGLTSSFFLISLGCVSGKLMSNPGLVVGGLYDRFGIRGPRLRNASPDIRNPVQARAPSRSKNSSPPPFRSPPVFAAANSFRGSSSARAASFGSAARVPLTLSIFAAEHFAPPFLIDAIVANVAARIVVGEDATIFPSQKSA